MISPGLATGRITDQYVRKTPAPSMRAASSIVVGMITKNCRMRKMPAASATIGRIIPG